MDFLEAMGLLRQVKQAADDCVHDCMAIAVDERLDVAERDDQTRVKVRQATAVIYERVETLEAGA